VKIERLTFKIWPPEFVKDFLQVDNEVRTPWLQRQPGFMNKTSEFKANGEVSILIFWKSDSDWFEAKSKVLELESVERLLKQRSPGFFRLISSLSL
jgi:hypothetical protein